MIVVEELAVARGGTLILDGVSFAAGAGEFIGIIGPNGAGKSTLLRAVAGLEPPTAGSATLGGIDAHLMSPRRRARTLAFLPQAREVHWAMTAEAIVGLGRFAYGAPHRLGPADRAAVERALTAADCGSFRARVASTLSGGEQARIHLARALAAEAPILLADEPTAALDLAHALAIVARLRAQANEGGLVLAALHDVGLAQQACTRLILLDRGRIVADGAPAEALTAARLTSVFGVSIDAAGGFRLAARSD